MRHFHQAFGMRFAGRLKERRAKLGRGLLALVVGGLLAAAVFDCNGGSAGGAGTGGAAGGAPSPGTGGGTGQGGSPGAGGTAATGGGGAAGGGAGGASAIGGQTGAGGAPAIDGPRLVQNFNQSWKFKRADVTGAEGPPFDASPWDAVGLPHSFTLPYFQPTNMSLKVYVGYGWYRKHFTVPSTWSGKSVSLEFQAAFDQAQIYVNGKQVGVHIGGYN